MSKQTLTFVSHTHWDREWYQPFEEFRIRLVQLVDKLLEILDRDPEYKYFMLDGQTIALDDYLAIRPENRAKIESYVKSGRIQIGPWYILPDEFLVSGESTIRNLLVGAQMCTQFGKRMNVGNIPDPFGHISQLPQILKGFDIDSVVFTRGVSDVQNEFVWQAPDGTDILVIHQQHGYGNASGMPNDEAMFIKRTQQISDSLTPTATTPHLLAMNGSDHVEPMHELPRLLAAADTALPDIDVRHGTLPQFVEMTRTALHAENSKLETRYGELRESAKFPLLPGVLSTRMWIKQRNAACETLLTRWAEPLTAIVRITGAVSNLEKQSAPLVKQAWRYLLQNHPHDSICGCSIDQVHKEMDVRFDWVDQIGEQVTTTNLNGLAAIIDTENPQGQPAVIVFNPTTHRRSDIVQAQVPVSEDGSRFVLVTDQGEIVQPQILEHSRDVVWEFDMPIEQFMLLIKEVPYEIEDAGIQELRPHADGAVLNLDILLSKTQSPNIENIKLGQAEVMRVLDDSAIEQVHLLLYYGNYAHCTFIASDVPGLGYRSFWVQPVDETTDQTEKTESTSIENEFFHIQVDQDGTFTLTDKTTGKLYPGLNRFIDVGDRGDEYNFCPVEQDMIVNAPTGDPLIRLTKNGPARQTIEVSMRYQVPVSLGKTRFERSDERVELPIRTQISLSPGLRRVELSTTVTNNAADHRLRAHFPIPVNVDTFDVEGHFDVVSRPLDPPTDTQGWVEQPASTHPQCAWAQVSDGKTGLMVANRGLPEIEALRTDHGTELALTLLRSVGWLSRADMSIRQGHAGPGFPTPEAQCIGEYSFDYALIPHGGTWTDAFDQAQAFTAPLRAASTASHPGKLSSKGSFIDIGPDNLVVTAVKEAEDGRGLIVRFWNTNISTCDAVVKFWQKPITLSRCTLGERILESLDTDATGSATVPVRGREIVTLLAIF